LARLARRAGDSRNEDAASCLKSLLEIVDEQFDDLAVICADLVDATASGASAS
jgi:hypothetical protein